MSDSESYREQESEQSQIIIVTGYSGAGKSTVLRALEDVGFFCVDNLPLALLDYFFHCVAREKIHERRLALGIDVRGGSNIEQLITELQKFCTQQICPIKIFFLTSSSAVLVKRFQETRRKHPLADEIDLFDAIEREKILLRPLIDMSDLVLDTDQLNIHQLRSFVRSSFIPGGHQRMIVSLMSFGFKHGVPLESNFVYDVRSLPNPHFIPELKQLSGIDGAVVAYLFSQPEVIEYWAKLLDFITYTIERSHAEGRFFLNIAIGCTGGQHRSVAFVEKLANQVIPNVQFLSKHRDIQRDLIERGERQKEESLI